MRDRFELEIAPLRLSGEVGVQGALDVHGPGVMALDQVAVIAVHAAHEVAHGGRGARREPARERGRLRGQQEGKVAQAGPGILLRAGQQGERRGSGVARAHDGRLPMRLNALEKRAKQ